MPKAKWFAGKVTHKTRKAAEDAAEYLKRKDIPYRIRAVKKGFKVDMKMWV